VLPIASVVAVVLILAGCESPAYSPGPLATASAKPPAVSVAFPAMGVYEGSSPLNWSGVASFAKATHTAVTIADYYSSWDESFKTAFAVAAARHGAEVLVYLEPWTVSVASIAAGRSDSYLRSYAAAVKAFGDPVILSFGHEMNGCWYPWGRCKTPPRVFVAAWRHIVTVFRQMNVTNVKWLWEVSHAKINAFRSQYPGNNWVNYVGVTGYLAKSTNTFEGVFGKAIAQVRSFADLPVIIGETGVEPGPYRVAQLASLFAGAKADHVAGVVYFDVKQHGSPLRQDWRLEGDPAALRVFRKAARAYGA
jgi:mannan endo-1,4-beta-mannosidase